MSPKQWTYKQKNTALLVAALLFGLVGYYTAFGKTWYLWQENRRLQAQSHLASNIDAQILQLQQRNQRLGAFYTPIKAGVQSHHEEVLKQVSGFCQKNRLLVREIPPAVLHQETQYLIETNVVVVEGAFKDILGLIYDLEQISKTGRVASVSFEAGPDRKTRQYRLAAHIVIQNIKPRADGI